MHHAVLPRPSLAALADRVLLAAALVSVLLSVVLQPEITADIIRTGFDQTHRVLLPHRK